MGTELLRSAIEKVEFVGGADLRGTFWDERPCPIADPTKSLKRLGFLSWMPSLEEEDAVEDQFRPNISPTMEGDGFGRPDRAAAAGWWVHEGLVAGEGAQDCAAGFEEEN